MHHSLVFFIFAHPDDAEICCGGLIVKLVKDGSEVHYLCCTDGSRGTFNPDISPKHLAVIRDSELKSAAKDLGVKTVEILPHCDCDEIQEYFLRKEIIARIRRLQPEIVVTHDAWKPYLVHPDHIVTGLAACRAAVFSPFPHIYPDTFSPGVNSVREVFLFDTDLPNMFIDISEVIERKIHLLSHFPSQMEQAGAQQKMIRPDNRSNYDIGREMYEDIIRRTSTQAGVITGIRHAEAYRRFLVRNGHFDAREQERIPGK